jgi:hypothetical protein
LLAFNQAASRAAESEWILRQTIADFKSCDVYISRSAIKILNKERGVSLLAKAPDWTFYYFRPAEKVLWKGPIADINVRNFFNPPSFSVLRNSSILKASEKLPQNATTQLVGKTKFLGFPCESRIDSKGVTGFYITRAIPLDPMGAYFLTKLEGVPMTGAVPLRARHYRPLPNTFEQEHAQLKKSNLFWSAQSFSFADDQRTGLLEILNTQSCRKTQFNAEDFVLPNGYKSVKYMTDVTYSKDMKDSMQSLYDDLGPASSQSNSAKQVRLPKHP